MLTDRSNDQATTTGKWRLRSRVIMKPYGAVEHLSPEGKKSWILTGPICFIGSSVKCFIRLYSKEVNEKHCSIKIQILDNGERQATLSHLSTAKFQTLVNGKSIKSCVLKNKDVIQVGCAEFTWIASDNSALPQSISSQRKSLPSHAKRFKTLQSTRASDSHLQLRCKFSPAAMKSAPLASVKVPLQLESSAPKSLRKRSHSLSSVTKSKEGSAKKMVNKVTSKSATKIPRIQMETKAKRTIPVNPELRLTLNTKPSPLRKVKRGLLRSPRLVLPTSTGIPRLAYQNKGYKVKVPHPKKADPLKAAAILTTYGRQSVAPETPESKVQSLQTPKHAKLVKKTPDRVTSLATSPRCIGTTPDKTPGMKISKIVSPRSGVKTALKTNKVNVTNSPKAESPLKSVPKTPNKVETVLRSSSKSRETHIKSPQSVGKSLSENSLSSKKRTPAAYSVLKSPVGSAKGTPISRTKSLSKKTSLSVTRKSRGLSVTNSLPRSAKKGVKTPTKEIFDVNIIEGRPENSFAKLSSPKNSNLLRVAALRGATCKQLTATTSADNHFSFSLPVHVPAKEQKVHSTRQASPYCFVSPEKLPRRHSSRLKSQDSTPVDLPSSRLSRSSNLPVTPMPTARISRSKRTSLTLTPMPSLSDQAQPTKNSQKQSMVSTPHLDIFFSQASEQNAFQFVSSTPPTTTKKKSGSNKRKVKHSMVSTPNLNQMFATPVPEKKDLAYRASRTPVAINEFAMNVARANSANSSATVTSGAYEKLLAQQGSELVSPLLLLGRHTSNVNPCNFNESLEEGEIVDTPPKSQGSPRKGRKDFSPNEGNISNIDYEGVADLFATCTPTSTRKKRLTTDSSTQTPEDFSSISMTYRTPALSYSTVVSPLENDVITSSHPNTPKTHKKKSGNDSFTGLSRLMRGNKSAKKVASTPSYTGISRLLSIRDGRKTEASPSFEGIGEMLQSPASDLAEASRSSLRRSGRTSRIDLPGKQTHSPGNVTSSSISPSRQPLGLFQAASTAPVSPKKIQEDIRNSENMKPSVFHVSPTRSRSISPKKTISSVASDESVPDSTKMRLRKSSMLPASPVVLETATTAKYSSPDATASRSSTRRTRATMSPVIIEINDSEAGPSSPVKKQKPYSALYIQMMKTKLNPEAILNELIDLSDVDSWSDICSRSSGSSQTSPVKTPTTSNKSMAASNTSAKKGNARTALVLDAASPSRLRTPRVQTPRITPVESMSQEVKAEILLDLEVAANLESSTPTSRANLGNTSVTKPGTSSKSATSKVGKSTRSEFTIQSPKFQIMSEDEETCTTPANGRITRQTAVEQATVASSSCPKPEPTSENEETCTTPANGRVTRQTAVEQATVASSSCPKPEPTSENEETSTTPANGRVTRQTAVDQATVASSSCPKPEPTSENEETCTTPANGRVTRQTAVEQATVASSSCPKPEPTSENEETSTTPANGRVTRQTAVDQATVASSSCPKPEPTSENEETSTTPANGRVTRQTAVEQATVASSSCPKPEPTSENEETSTTPANGRVTRQTAVDQATVASSSCPKPEPTSENEETSTTPANGRVTRQTAVEQATVASSSCPKPEPTSENEETSTTPANGRVTRQTAVDQATVASSSCPKPEPTSENEETSTTPANGRVTRQTAVEQATVASSSCPKPEPTSEIEETSITPASSRVTEQKPVINTVMLALIPKPELKLEDEEALATPARGRVTRQKLTAQTSKTGPNVEETVPEPQTMATRRGRTKREKNTKESTETPVTENVKAQAVTTNYKQEKKASQNLLKSSEAADSSKTEPNAVKSDAVPSTPRRGRATRQKPEAASPVCSKTVKAKSNSQETLEPGTPIRKRGKRKPAQEANFEPAAPSPKHRAVKEKTVEVEAENHTVKSSKQARGTRAKPVEEEQKPSSSRSSRSRAAKCKVPAEENELAHGQSPPKRGKAQIDSTPPTPKRGGRATRQKQVTEEAEDLPLKRKNTGKQKKTNAKKPFEPSAECETAEQPSGRATRRKAEPTAFTGKAEVSTKTIRGKRGAKTEVEIENLETKPCVSKTSKDQPTMSETPPRRQLRKRI